MTNKNANRLTGLIAALAAAVALVATPAAALNLSELQIAHENEVYDARYVTEIATTPGRGDEQSALKLFYTGAATEAVVTINSTGLLFYAPAGTLDTTFPSGALPFSTYATVGALCDAINKTAGVYQCRMEDARRSDLPNTLYGATATGGANNLKANGGYVVAITSGNGNNSTTVGSTYLSLGINPPAGKRVILKKCSFFGEGTAGINVFTVSGVKRYYENSPDGVVRNDSTIVYRSTQAVSTATTVSFDSSGVGGISFATASEGIPGPATGLPLGGSSVQSGPANSLGRVVVRLDSNGTQLMSTDAYLSCEWTGR